MLLVAAGTKNPDSLVDLLLAPLAPEVYLHQRQGRGLTTERIIAALIRLAEGVLGADA